MSSQGGNVKEVKKAPLKHDLPKGFKPGDKPSKTSRAVKAGGASKKPAPLKSVVPKKKK